MNTQAIPVAADGSGLTTAVFMALVIGSLCAAGGTFLLKLGATGNVGLLAFINLRIVSGLALYGLGSASWIYGMSRAPLSVVYPFNALTFVLVTVSACVFLGERPTTASLCGSALILSGIGCIAVGNLS
jgi:drug/metabolite transporter (DMT)-like permease